MKVIVLLCFFISSICFSQGTLDFGDVKGEDIKSCAGGNICHSKYQLEIYLFEISFPGGSAQAIDLCYDGKAWKAIKFKGRFGVFTDSFKVSPIFNYDILFSELKKNKIFTLPNQEELKYTGDVDDGREYSLAFKAGNLFRSYSFRNPDIFKEYNKNITEFENYVNIVDILYNWLKKE